MKFADCLDVWDPGKLPPLLISSLFVVPQDFQRRNSDKMAGNLFRLSGELKERQL